MQVIPVPASDVAALAQSFPGVLFHLHSLSHCELSLYISDFHLQKDFCIHLQFETLCSEPKPDLDWVYRAGRKVCRALRSV